MIMDGVRMTESEKRLREQRIRLTETERRYRSACKLRTTSSRELADMLCELERLKAEFLPGVAALSNASAAH